jgi:hypothetical protein
MAASDLTAARLRELLHYDPETGAFTWRIRRGSRQAGQPTGSAINSHGYMQIGIDGKLKKAHVLAWLYMTGEHPESLVDHKDGTRTNNIFSNLRSTTYTVNAENRRLPRLGCESGFLGVSRQRRIDKWQAAIQINGRKRYLGVFGTPEEAHAVYLDAKRKLHEGCTI